MPLKITMAVTCDGCGCEIARLEDVKITDVAHEWGKLKHPNRHLERVNEIRAKKGLALLGEPTRMMIVERYMRTPKTFCLTCADRG